MKEGIDNNEIHQYEPIEKDKDIVNVFKPTTKIINKCKHKIVGIYITKPVITPKYFGIMSQN